MEASRLILNYQCGLLRAEGSCLCIKAMDSDSAF